MSEINNQVEDEIDIVGLLKKAYKEKRLIFKYSIIAAIIGVVFAFKVVSTSPTPINSVTQLKPPSSLAV